MTLADLLHALAVAPSRDRIQLLPDFRDAITFVPRALRRYRFGQLETERVLEHLERRFVHERVRFQGARGERSARRLVLQIAHNRAFDILRHRQVRGRIRAEWLPVANVGADPAAAALVRINQAIRQATPDRSQALNISLVVETAFLGLTTLEQADRHRFGEARTGPDWKRTRNLIDSRRRHGRRQLLAVLVDLVARGAIHRLDAQLVAAACDCDLTPLTEPIAA